MTGPMNKKETAEEGMAHTRTHTSCKNKRKDGEGRSLASFIRGLSRLDGSGGGVSEGKKVRSVGGATLSLSLSLRSDVKFPFKLPRSKKRL